MPGRILAAWVLSFYVVGGVAGGYNVGTAGLGQNGWGAGYQGEYNLISAIAFEFIATLIFVCVILGATEKAAPGERFPGLGIGITLVVIHIFGIGITGVSMNPARSFGPALLVGGHALAQVWLFLKFPASPVWSQDCFSGSRRLRRMSPCRKSSTVATWKTKSRCNWFVETRPEGETAFARLPCTS